MEAEKDYIRAAFVAWNEQGTAGFEPFLAETIEWHDPPEVPDGSVHRGRDETMARLRGFEPGSGQMRVSLGVEDVLGDGVEYVVISRARVTGETSGTSMPEHRWFHVVRVDDGKLARVRVFLDRDQALDAAGLRQ